MVKGKLILICHYGGQFNNSDDGSSSYEGGEANAVNINNDTVFDDLKLKLAEMCNFDHKSVSVKYFLPGNSRSLINLGNHKDLTRMISFHENSVTADIYIFGKVGFHSSAAKVKAGRAIGVKVAETVDHGTACDVLSADTSDSSYSMTTSSSEPSEPSDDSSESYNPRSSKYKRYVPETSLMSPNSADVDGKAVADNSASVCMISTPADTVKKRRRAAGCKAFGSDSATTTATDGIEKRVSVTRRKKKPRRTLADLADEVDALHSDSDPEDSHAPSTLDNVAPGQVVASWKKAISSVGQEFRNVDEFREALRRYAVAHQFAYKLKKSDATRVSCRCADEGCPWRIYASKVQAGQTFRIKKMVKSHTCRGESRKRAQPTRRWLVSVVKEILQDVPHIKPKNIARRITDDYGIQVKMYLVRRAIEDVKVQVMGSQAEAYDELPKFCKKVVELNPGSLVKLVTGDDKRFQRLFLCFHAFTFGFEHGCRPLLFLDSTSLRSKYHESLLLAVALDGNDGLFPLAIGVVDVENEDNWIWFLEELKTAIPALMILTLVSDREKLQKESIFKVFENARIGYSLRHLIGSFNVNMKGPFTGDGRGFLAQSLTNAAHATRLDVFEKYMAEIKQISPSSHEWLLQTGPEHWASAIFVGEQYNQISENPLELLDKVLEEEKAFPITHKLEAMVSKMSEMIIDRQTESTGWSLKLTPSKDRILQSRILKSQKLRVLFSNELLFEVRDDYTNAVNVFNITTMDCSCGVWRVTGIPCSHAVAVFNCTGRDAYDYCSPFFTADRYKMTYSKSITPLPVNDNEYSTGDAEAKEHAYEVMECMEGRSECVKGNEHLSENVTGNERSSDIMMCNEHPSENLEGKKHLSEVVGGNEHPVEMVEGNDHPLEVVHPFKVVKGNRHPFEIVDSNMHPSGIVEGIECPSGIVECNNPPSDNLEGNERSSDKLEGNDQPSDNLEGSELPSDVLEGTERPSDSLEGSEQPSDNLEGSEQPYDNLEGSEHPSDILEGSEHPFDNVEGIECPSDDVEGNERPSENAEGTEHPSHNVEGNQRPSDNVEGLECPSENVEGNQRPSDNLEGLECPSENVEGNHTPSKNVKGKELSTENSKRKGRPSENGRSSENVKGSKRSSKEVEVLPPCTSRRSEQDKVKQIKPVDPTKRTVICTRCLGAGHNKKTCKATLD